MTLQQLTTPFWRGTRIENETAVMIEREDGTISARLLFRPTRIETVLDHTLGAAYEEGKDFLWDGDTTLIRTPDSRIPYFAQGDLEGVGDDGQPLPVFAGSFDEKGRSRFGRALFCTGPFLYEKQFAVTYRHAQAWDGPIPTGQLDHLPRFREKLWAGEPLRITFFGDSIFTGCDCSSALGRPPYQTSFPTLVPSALTERYGCAITLHNPSVGGMNSVWGMENAHLAFEGSPDLLILGFGMNDGAFEAKQSAEHIASLISQVKKACPTCEILVTTPMVPNAEAGFLVHHADLRREYGKLVCEGIGFVDFYSIHEAMLAHKDFAALSGNDINHPNDFLIRTYAAAFLAALTGDVC